MTIPVGRFDGWCHLTTSMGPENPEHQTMPFHLRTICYCYWRKPCHPKDFCRADTGSILSSCLWNHCTRQCLEKTFHCRLSRSPLLRPSDSPGSRGCHSVNIYICMGHYIPMTVSDWFLREMLMTMTCISWQCDIIYPFVCMTFWLSLYYTDSETLLRASWLLAAGACALIVCVCVRVCVCVGWVVFQWDISPPLKIAKTWKQCTDNTWEYSCRDLRTFWLACLLGGLFCSRVLLSITVSNRFFEHHYVYIYIFIVYI